MSPSQQCKEAGLKSFVELVRISGMHESTLHHWYKNKPQQFACMVAGGAAISHRKRHWSSPKAIEAGVKKDNNFMAKLSNLSTDDQKIIAQLVNRFFSLSAS